VVKGIESIICINKIDFLLLERRWNLANTYLHPKTKRQPLFQKHQILCTIKAPTMEPRYAATINLLRTPCREREYERRFLSLCCVVGQEEKKCGIKGQNI
jgi:hypothetical protein